MDTRTLNLAARRRLVERLSAGASLIAVAEEFGIARDTAAGLFHRWLLHGEAALVGDGIDRVPA